MIRKVKDLSRVQLNAQDVMLMATVKSKIKSSLDLSGMNQKDKEAMEELIKLEIIAVGSEVGFKPKQLVAIKARAGFEYTLLEETTDKNTFEKTEFRIAVMHMNNIEYAINEENLC